MRKFEPADHSAHLAELLAQLFKVEDFVTANDREGLLRLVLDMDWRAIADEFELVVANHCFALEHYAHRISNNLQRPYLLLQDCIGLEHDMRTLEGTIEQSPSLIDDADRAVAHAWASEVEKARRRHRPMREAPAVTTLNELRAAVTGKVRLGRALLSKNVRFDAGERVPYGDVESGQGDSPPSA